MDSLRCYTNIQTKLNICGRMRKKRESKSKNRKVKVFKFKFLPRPKTGEDAANKVASSPSRPLPPPKPSNPLPPRVFVQEGVAERAVPRGRRQHRRGDSGGLANHEYRVVRGTHGSVIPGIIAVDTLSFGFTPPLGHGTSTTA